MLISFSELEVYNQSFDVCAGSSNTISSYAMRHIYCEKLPSIKICICSSNATFTLIWRKKNCSFFWQGAGETAGKYFCRKWQCSMMEMGQIFPEHAAVSLPQISKVITAYIRVMSSSYKQHLWKILQNWAWRPPWLGWERTDRTDQIPQKHLTLSHPSARPTASSASQNSILSVATAHSTLHPTRHCSSPGTYKWRRTRPLIRRSQIK